MTGPARGYKWADATPDNQLAVKHGLFRAGRAEEVAPRVEEEAARIVEEFPHMVAFVTEQQKIGRVRVDIEDGLAYLDAVGWFDEDHNERSEVRTVEKLLRREERLSDKNGLTPMSQARLMHLLSEVVRRHPQRHPSGLSGPLAALLDEGRRALQRGARSRAAEEEDA